MKEIITIGVVNFNAKWGKKNFNYERIVGYIEAASKRGVDFLIFPELCLTGYDDQKEVDKEQKMHVKLAESKYGEMVSQLLDIAKAHEIYVVLGMPEKNKKADNIIHNTALVVTSDHRSYTYRKIHLALDEPNWATPGQYPLLIDTPWGPIGIAICYDLYAFPELIRYYAAKGARLVINSTAYAKSRGAIKGRTTLESTVLMNGIYVATANLCGKDLVNEFWGGSSIIGPSRKMQEVHYYAGKPFGDTEGEEEELYIATIDLALAERGIYEENNRLGRSDFRPNLYAGWYQELAQIEMEI